MRLGVGTPRAKDWSLLRKWAIIQELGPPSSPASWAPSSAHPPPQLESLNGETLARENTDLSLFMHHETEQPADPREAFQNPFSHPSSLSCSVPFLGIIFSIAVIAT